MINKKFSEIISFLKKNKLYKQNFHNKFVFYSKDNCSGKIFVSINMNQKTQKKYIIEAIENGAKAIILDQKIKIPNTFKNIPILYSKELKNNYNEFFNYIYSEPLNKMTVIGVTGTDGKTSQLHILAQCFSLSGDKIGVISSEGNGIYPKLQSTDYTTPRIDILYKYFYFFKTKRVNKILIECSSQGLEQDRLINIKFDISILTNINKDHIEHHKSIKNYIKSKFKLMNMTKKHIFLNQDCKRTKKNIKLITSKAKQHLYNSHINLDLYKIKIPQTISNLYNLRATYEILKIYKFSSQSILELFNKLKPVNGRNQFIKTKNKGIYIIDYAHTPSSLLTLLKEIRIYASINSSKIITVFGCGGNRDVWKRKEMGRISSVFSDYIILTDDNPRNEKPMKILNDIKQGIKITKKVFLIPSRKKAIYKAISLAEKNDYIIIAGKGNENSIMYKGHKLAHNDYEILRSRIK